MADEQWLINHNIATLVMELAATTEVEETEVLEKLTGLCFDEEQAGAIQQIINDY